MIELILGGARSGKSRYAEQQALASNKKLTYIATAQILDDEMARRVDIHKQRRTSDWCTVEEPYALGKVLQEKAHQDHCILVDCLTLWLSNLLHSDKANAWQEEKNSLLQVLPALPGLIILVSNEVGSGIVPMGKLSRRYVDEIGWLHQDIASLSDKVTYIVAGLPQILKGQGL
ncbi:MAG: bifunctional adenosylcobinamide kinase/adenosylcobinamide-phosphate guanylyltransferase [Gammaproteobacteria bacterium]|nr:bifunctional adenosylcobinamide kinase/adenosylcobinamide-phosphate guanylyltransferase [Gammaproteobacteria bacterium]